MTKFFETYPKVIYKGKIVTDILSRMSIRDNYTDKLTLYYEYILKEGDTAEIIAAKYYNDPNRHWIVLTINDISNAFFDMPLSTRQFELYLDSKYKIEGDLIDRTGSEYARSTININPVGYRAVVSTTDTISGKTTVEKFNIDTKATHSLYSNQTFNYPDYIKQVGDIVYEQTTEYYTIYDHELGLNEQKRHIKLLRKEYVSRVEDELKSIMKKVYV